MLDNYKVIPSRYNFMVSIISLLVCLIPPSIPLHAVDTPWAQQWMTPAEANRGSLYDGVMSCASA